MLWKSSINVALIFFAVILVSSVLGMIIVISVYGPEYSLIATKLTRKPDRSFLADPRDSFLVEAVNNPDTPVIVGRNLDGTQVDELVLFYNTSIVEYEDSYYTVRFFFAEKFPPAGLQFSLMIVILVSLVAVVIISSFKATEYVRKRNANLKE